MLQMCLKYPYLFLKHARNSIRASDSPDYGIFDIPSLRGSRPAPPPELKILNIALEVLRPMQFQFTAVNCVSCENLSKIEQL